MAMAVRKINNGDVRAIFESLHDNKPPPPGITFKIVPVDSDGLKLSPPSHEYEDGIYVLLRADKSKKKKKKNVAKEQYKRPKIPPHLAHLKMETPLSKNCAWSLSGPQFPIPTAIQQRYCYPQGNHEYASKKGASLWTMYNCEGEEDYEYRLLHVYYSIKRANNSSTKAIKAKKLSISSTSKKRKKPNRQRASVHIGKETKKTKQSISKLDCRSMIPERLRPSSPCAMKNQIFRQPYIHVSPNTASTSSGCIHQDLSRHGSFGCSFEGHKIYTVPSILYNDEYLPFRSNQTLQYQEPDIDNLYSDHSQKPHVQSPLDMAREFDALLGVPLADPSSMINEQKIEWSALTDTAEKNHVSTCRRQKNSEVLMQKLIAVHKKIINEWIGSKPRSERGQLVSVVANWARSVSKSPLEILVSSERHGEQSAQCDGRNLSSQMEDLDMAVEV